MFVVTTWLLTIDKDNAILLIKADNSDYTRDIQFEKFIQDESVSLLVYPS